ncbi:MAG: hypothetical protein IV100_10540 [Myxococcales bacterium]|nr:hypothetical protein [Myxococcales bacterium]
MNGQCAECAPEEEECFRCKRSPLGAPISEGGVLVADCGALTLAQCFEPANSAFCSWASAVAAYCRPKPEVTGGEACESADQSECTSSPLSGLCDWIPEVPGFCRATPAVNVCCDDGNERTVADHIVALSLAPGAPTSAVCLGTDRCDEGNPCTRDYWDENLPGGQCVHEPWYDSASSTHFFDGVAIPAGAEAIFPCDDGDACTFLDRCDGFECRGSPVELPLLPTGDPMCHRLVCYGDGRAEWASLEGTLCSDGNPCTSGERCVSGDCDGGEEADCSDDDPCTLNAPCSAQDGCVLPSAPSGTPCDDGRACTVGDACLGAGQTICVGTVECDDADPNTTDYCRESTGACAHTPNTPAGSVPFPDVFLGPPDDPRDFAAVNMGTSGSGSVPPPPPGFSGSNAPPGYATLESVTYCSSAVAFRLNQDVQSACPDLASDCDTTAAPSCIAYPCSSSTCAVPTDLPDVAMTVRRVEGRNTLPGYMSGEGLVALNARPWFDGVHSDGRIIGTFGMWVGLDGVHGVYGIGRVPLLDTAIPGSDPTARMRIEIGHWNDANVESPSPEDGFGSQQGRDLRGIILELASGGVRRRVTAPIYDWARGGWHHVAVTLGTNSLCVYLDGVDVACIDRPAGLFTVHDVGDYLFMLGSVRRGQTGIDETSQARVRVAGLEAWRAALEPEQIAARFRSLVPVAVTIDTGAMQLGLGGAEDGFGIVSLRDLDRNRDWSPAAPSRGLFRLRLIARHDLHTGFHLRPLDRQLPPTDFPPPPPGSTSVRPLEPPAYTEAADNTFRPARAQTPWAFYVDSLSVLGGTPPTHGTSLSPDGRTLHFFQWTDLPLPDPTEFVAGPTDEDVWNTKRYRVVLPFSCQSYTSSSDGDSFCEGDPNRPEAGRIASATVVLWAVPGESAVRGFLTVDLDSEYWSLAESSFPTFEISLSQGNAHAGANLIVPDDNLGRLLPLDLVKHPMADSATFQKVFTAPDLYPSRHLSLPLIGIDTSASNNASLYLGALDATGRLRHIPLRRRVKTAMNEVASNRAPAEPRLALSMSEPEENASLPGNDRLGGLGVVELALVKDGWHGMARRYRQGLLDLNAWPGPMAGRSDMPNWLVSAGYFLAGSDPATPRLEATYCAASGLPSDLAFFEYRAWDRTNGTSRAVYGDDTQTDDIPWAYPEHDEFLPDFEFLRRAQPLVGLSRRTARHFEAVLETMGIAGASRVPGPAVSLYTNPALLDLGRNWAVSTELSPAFSRIGLWPYRSELRLPAAPTTGAPLDPGDPLDPDGSAPVAWQSVGKGFDAGRTPLQPMPDTTTSGPLWPPPLAPGPWSGLKGSTPSNEPEIAQQSSDYPISRCQANQQLFYACPGHPDLRAMQVERLTRWGTAPLDPSRRSRVAGLYADQYSTLSPRMCWSRDHGGEGGHAPGGGAYWTDGWRDVLSDARSAIRSVNPDGGLYSEGFSAPFAGYSDGFLVLHDSFDLGIPLVQAVFHDTAVFIGRYVELSGIAAANRSAALARTVGLQAEAFVQGRMPGGLSNDAAGQLNSHAYAYVRQLGAWRRRHADSLVFGEMLETPGIHQVGASVSDSCAVTDAPPGGAVPALVDTQSGVSVAAPAGQWVPIETIRMTAKSKDVGDPTTWDEPAASASLWRTRGGKHKLVIASADTERRRTVGLTIADVSETASTPVIVRQFDRDGAVVGFATIDTYLDGELRIQVTLPPCSVSVFELEVAP